MQFTEEQRRAIEARGTNLLLSAAAGSGKTAVLVQRVLSPHRGGRMCAACWWSPSRAPPPPDALGASPRPPGRSGRGGRRACANRCSVWTALPSARCGASAPSFCAPTSRPRAWTPPSAYSTTPRTRACWTRRRTRPWTPSTRKAAKRLPASTPGAARTRCAIWRCASTPSSASAPTPRRGWNAPLTPDRRPCRRGRTSFCAPPAARWTRRWP